MRKKKSILIIGGTGFIGYHLAKKTLKKGWIVTSISTKKPKKKRYLSKVQYLICDISKKKSLKKKITRSFDYVVNLGGHVNHSNSKKTFQSHFLGSKNLAEIFINTGIKSFVQMGSSGEYGTLKSPQLESYKCNPRSIYGRAKLLATQNLMKLSKEKNFPATVLRLYQAYGPKQDFNRFIPIIIKACIKNKKFPCSEGKQFRDFIHVNDVLNAIIFSLLKKNAKGEIINIGSGKPKKIKSIINYLKKKLKGGHPEFGKIKLRKDEILKIYPSIYKAKKILNWKPKISFDSGLNSTIQFYNNDEKQ